MGNRKRVYIENGIFHITCRGNRKEAIFNDDMDYKVYIKILKENLKYYKYFNYKVIQYCLMSNHVHLMIQINKEPLGVFMQRLNSKYTIYYNNKYDYVGHLFQGRYFSELIRDNAHLLEVSRYIHLNPVKAKIVNEPIKYIWSSYKDFIEEKYKINRELYKNKLENNNSDDYLNISNPQIILDFFSNRRKYKEFVELELKNKNNFHIKDL